MAKHDSEILTKWKFGFTLEKLSEEYKKTPTSIASKLVRLAVFSDRKEVEIENFNRGGFCRVEEENDKFYSIYLIRCPSNNNPIYIGQTQNYKKRIKTHKRKFTKHFNGNEPIIEILETVEKYSDARVCEKKHIAEFTMLGYKLLNIQDREFCEKL
jgi:predicted GIY-YIG superfamily endonuclease